MLTDIDVTPSTCCTWFVKEPLGKFAIVKGLRGGMIGAVLS